MKTSIILLALSLALSASAVPQPAQSQAASVNEDFRFGGNRNGGGRGGNNNNNGGNRGSNQNAGGAAGSGNNNANGGSAAGSNSTSTGSAGSAAGSNSTSTGSAGSAAGSNSTSSDSGDPQTSLTLNPAVIAPGFANNGQDVPTAGQVASLTSTNNFINFCLTVPNLPITNGQQIKTGSCNPAPMGVIPSTDNMPSAKFVFPKNGDVVPANEAFNITMNIQGMQTGFFVNADENYFAAPQFTNAQGQIQGHSHVVVEALSSLTQTEPTTPTTFAFFKGLNSAAVGGQLSAAVPSGLPAGAYKLSSINTAANHQPVLVPVAQHGSLDDAVYFTVSDGGQASADSGVFGGSNSTAAAGNAGTAAAGAASASSTDTAAAAAGTAGTGNTGAGNAGAAGKGGKANQNQNNNAGNGGKGNNRTGGGRNRRFARSRLL